MSMRARQWPCEQPGECAGADSHDGGWRWDAPLGRVAWSRLDPHTGSGTVLFGSVPLSTLNAQPPKLKCGLITRGQGARTLRLYKTANQVRPWPPRAASWHRASVSQWDGRITFNVRRSAPPLACTTPVLILLLSCALNRALAMR
jgi:hypothetical protein